MMRVLWITLLSSIFLFSCKNDYNNKKEPEVQYTYKTPLNDRDLINRLITQALDSGNKNAYNEVASYHLLESQGEEFLYYAIKFANKYNSAEAYYHIYYILVTPRNGVRLNDLDEKTKNFALYYLLKSYEMGYHSSQFETKEVFKDSTEIPESSYYLEEFIKANGSGK